MVIQYLFNPYLGLASILQFWFFHLVISHRAKSIFFSGVKDSHGCPSYKTKGFTRLAMLIIYLNNYTLMMTL